MHVCCVCVCVCVGSRFGIHISSKQCYVPLLTPIITYMTMAHRLN
jgi:hypothetical protein